MKVNKKITIIAVISFAAIFLFLVVLFIIQSLNDNPSISEDGQPSDNAKALLVVIDPSFTITRGDRTFDINSGETEVFVGDIIKSDTTGIGYIIFSDNSIISLDNETEIEIVENTNQEESFNVQVKQILGRTWSRVVNLTVKKADYRIETSNTIAVVRGTKFGCIVEDDITTCSTYQGAITLNLKNISEFENTIPLVAGVSFTNDDSIISEIESYDELLKQVKTYEIGEERWVDFNDCLDYEMKKILKSDEEKIINYLIQYEDHRKCTSIDYPDYEDDESEEGEVEGAIDRRDEQDTADVQVVSIQNVSIGLNSVSKTISCSWEAQNASYYEVSTGSSSGSSDTAGWTKTSSGSHSFSSLPLISGETYFCNIRAYLNSSYEQKSSIGVYFDQGTGSFNVGSFSPNNDGTYVQSTGVSGTGSISNVPLSHVGIRFYFQNQIGEYFSPSSWCSNMYWYSANPVDLGSGNFSFSEIINVDATPKMRIHYELFNIHSGNVIHTHTVQNVSCS
jgi:hypothetical protein